MVPLAGNLCRILRPSSVRQQSRALRHGLYGLALALRKLGMPFSKSWKGRHALPFLQSSSTILARIVLPTSSQKELGQVSSDSFSCIAPKILGREIAFADALEHM